MARAAATEAAAVVRSADEDAALSITGAGPAQMSACVGEVDAYSVTGVCAAGELLGPYCDHWSSYCRGDGRCWSHVFIRWNRRRVGEGRLGRRILDQWS